MLHPNIYDIIKYASTTGYSDILLFTRATLIDQHAAKKLRASGLQRTQVAIDTHIPEEYDNKVGDIGAFSKMLTGMYYLREMNIKSKIIIVVTKDNIETVPDTIEYFVTNGFSDVHCEEVAPVGRAGKSISPTKKDIENLKRIIEEKRSTDNRYNSVSMAYAQSGKLKSCGGGIGSSMVFADGSVGPCDRWHDLKKDHSFGNIYDTSFRDIWMSDGAELFRNIRDYNNCSNCKHLAECRGGCVLNAHIENNEFGSDPYCTKKA